MPASGLPSVCKRLPKLKGMTVVLAFLFTFALVLPAIADNFNTRQRHHGSRSGESNIGKVTTGIIVGTQVIKALSNTKKKKRSTPKKNSYKKRALKKKPAKKKRVAKKPGPAPVLPRFRNNEILVSFIEGARDDAIQAFAAQFALNEIDVTIIELINQEIVRYSFDGNESPERLASRLSSNPLVSSVQPNWLYGLAGSGNFQYALSKLKIRRAHKISRGKGILVAVIDSGIDSTHPALQGVVAGQFDAVESSLEPKEPHGTAVASIISARKGMTAVAPDAQILSVRAFAPDKKGKPAVATSLNLLRSIDWSVKQGAHILNLSFAGPRDALIEKALIAAGNSDIIAVAAAGNKGKKAPPAYPAAYDNVIAATATDSKNKLYRHANHGDYIEIAAPGVDILVASRKKNYSLMSGTSMAAAYISGSVALILQRNPTLDHATVMSQLASSAKDLGKKGKDTEFGHGLANTYEVLNRINILEPPKETAQK